MIFLELKFLRRHTTFLRKVISKGSLFILFLPPYSPELNLAETVWRKMKGEWIDPEDYLEKDSLFYAVNRSLANLGRNLIINFSDFNLN